MMTLTEEGIEHPGQILNLLDCLCQNLYTKPIKTIWMNSTEN